MIYLRKENSKFIASLPAYCVDRVYAINQTPRKRLQKPVADRMPKRVIDVFEAIHIQAENRNLLPMALR